MPTKTSIYDNVEQYSAQDLYKFVTDGIIEYDELCRETAGYLPADVRKELKRLIDEGPAAGNVASNAAVSSLTPPPFPGYGPGTAYTGSNVWEESTPASQGDSDDPWNLVDKSDIQALSDFIVNNPNHNMVFTANQIRNRLFTDQHMVKDIETLKREVTDIMTNKTVIDKGSKIFSTIQEYVTNNYITTADILNLIADDHNFVSAAVVKDLIDSGFISYPDLAGAGIDQAFINHLINRDQDESLHLTPKQITQISKVSTEVYFWGIPSSGKTCALGGILSTAKNGRIAKNMSPDNDCQGYGYMTRLADVFRENNTVGNLPPGTAIYDIWEMGFDLEDPKGRIHPITCIDLAGELVRCMYKNDAGEPLTEDETATLETITNLLVSNRSTNRKMHFFVLEYGGEERKYEGLDQASYLQAALAYIKRTKIFNRDTDGVYLLFTKVDKTKLRGQALVEHLIEYTDRYYANFYNGLAAICKDYEINGGKVERLPFTLGNVCFQNYCLFDGTAAENVVKLLLNRTKGFKKGKIPTIINKLKG